jgi:hypothetical protein
MAGEKRLGRQPGESRAGLTPPRLPLRISPALGLGILCLQGVEHQEVLVRAPIAIRQCLGIGFDVKQRSGNLASLAVVQPGQLGQDFRLAHEVTLSGHPHPREPCVGALLLSRKGSVVSVNSQKLLAYLQSHHAKAEAYLTERAQHRAAVRAEAERRLDPRGIRARLVPRRGPPSREPSMIGLAFDENFRSGAVSPASLRESRPVRKKWPVGGNSQSSQQHPAAPRRESANQREWHKGRFQRPIVFSDLSPLLKPTLGKQWRTSLPPAGCCSTPS